MSDPLFELEKKTKEELRISKNFLSQKREEVNKIQLDIIYYEGQVDILNFILKTIETERSSGLK